MVTRREFIRMGATLALGASAVPLLDACGGGSSGSGSGSSVAIDPTGPASLQAAWWGGTDRAQRTQQVIALFQKKYPKTTVSASFTDFNSYFQKLNTQAAGGGLPDIVQLGGGYVPQYAGEDQLLDLTKYVGATLHLSDFEKGQLDQGKVNGRLYAVSLGGNMPAVIYNQSLISAAGMQPPPANVTWDGFATYLGRLATRLPQGVYAADDASGTGIAVEVWRRQRGDESWTKDGKIAFTHEDIRSWFQYWADLRRSGLIVPGTVAAAAAQNGTNQGQPIVQRKAVFAFTYSNFLSQFQVLMTDKLGIMRFPSGGHQAGDYVQASQFFSVSARSRAAAQATAFIDFFTHDPDAVKVLGIERGIPASAKTRDIVAPTLKPYDTETVTFFSQAGPRTRPKVMIDPANAGAVAQALQRVALSIPLNNVSVADATNEYLSEAQKALSS